MFTSYESSRYLKLAGQIPVQPNSMQSNAGMLYPGT